MGRRSLGKLPVVVGLNQQPLPMARTTQLFILLWGGKITWKRNEDSSNRCERFLSASSYVLLCHFKGRQCQVWGFFYSQRNLIWFAIWKQNISQWKLVLHRHDAYIPFSVHKQRITCSASIINLPQILLIIGKSLPFWGADVYLYNQTLIWHPQT